MATDGPVLILAGAGSGKTKALTHRVAYLIGEKGVAPWRIMAITFTNKAAAQMRERINALVGYGAEQVWVSTFHSSCLRILRRFADRLGYADGFAIYDADDQKSLIRRVIKRLEYDPKIYRERPVLSVISAAKNSMISPQMFERESLGDFRMTRVAQIYIKYQETLKANNAMDFDDLLCGVVRLFEKEPEVLEYYQDRLLYIMVDEYQDTNEVQFRFLKLLAQKHGNICVVGDDDQSIYKFRGANIGNILSFEEAFPGARVIRLEQNYRSTKKILNVANTLISNNKGRMGKSLWTENDSGGDVDYDLFDTGRDEARAVIGEIVRNRGVFDYGACAVLYRTNAQSRLFEEECVSSGVPYRLVGGVNFYSRKEIKDILAYLRIAENPVDDVALMRILNVPRRAIGQVSQNRILAFAQSEGISFYDALERAEEIDGIKSALKGVRSFLGIIKKLRRMSCEMSLKSLIEELVDVTGYAEELESEGPSQAQTRWDNINELISKAADFEAEFVLRMEAGQDAGFDYDSADYTGRGRLSAFLEEVSLVADVDNMEDDTNKVTLMTMHGAKGLEFDRVFIVGMEDGLFPGIRSINSGDPSDLEEERRLCYVAITRAKKKLTMTGARRRMIQGEIVYQRPSRFMAEIPEFMLEEGMVMEQEKDNNANGKPGAGSYRPKPKVLNTESAAVKLGRQFEVKKQKDIDYGPGDRVGHMKFGNGTVREVIDGKKDYEVVVDFDNVGEKKLFASFAKLKKIDS